MAVDDEESKADRRDVGSNDDICVYWGEFGQDTERYDAYVAAQPWWWRLWHRNVNEWPLRRRFQRQLDRESSAEVLVTAGPELSMPNTRTLLEAYALRFEDVIRESGDHEAQKAAMDEIAYVAERRGLLENSNNPRRSSPEEFVMDLLDEVRDRMDFSYKYLKKPSAVTDLSDVLDVLQ